MYNSSFRKFSLLLVLLCSLTWSSAQVTPANNEDEYEKEYQKRIQKDYLFGVYIPKDLTDAFVSLNRLIDEESKTKFKNMGERDAVEKLHFSFGRWMIYNWSFYEGSRLSAYLRGLGIFRPDDMARFIIVSYHRNLNRKSLNVKDQLGQIKEKTELDKAAKLEGAEILHQETRKRKN